MAIALKTTLSRNADDILCAPVNTDETVMLSMSASCYYGLNQVGTRIWELLETPMTIEEMCVRLCEEFEVDTHDCQAAVLKFANELFDRGIVHAA